MRTAFAALILSFTMGCASTATVASPGKLEIPERKQTTLKLYMTAREALQAKQATPSKVLFVDVRTPEEYQFVGHAVATDANVPFLRFDYSAWDEKKGMYVAAVNKNFEPAIAKLLEARGLSMTDTIIVMCRSGERSAMAANALAKAGYTQVYSLSEGFEGDAAPSGENAGKRMLNGWKNAGLPWTYAMDKAKAYLE